MRATKRKGAFILFLLCAVMLAGCSLFGSGQENNSVNPPPTNQNSEEAQYTMVQDLEEEAQGDMAVTLYFEDANGFVAPLTMNIPEDEGVAKQALRYMVENGPVETLLPKGFQALLPEGTEILGMDIRDKLAIVDFSEEFGNYAAEDERKIMEAVTYALTSFPTVERVQLWIEGRQLTEMPVSGTPLDEAMTRAIGINLERGEGVNLAQSTPVTLYFQGETEDEMKYFVPVTRMINFTENVAEASLKELIKGPSSSSQLTSALQPDIQVLAVKEKEGLVTVNFNEGVQAEGNAVATDILQSVVFSLTDTVGAKEVQFMVNGNSNIYGTDNQSYAFPVSRPSEINPFKL